MRPSKRFRIYIGEQICSAEYWVNHEQYGKGWIIRLPAYVDFYDATIPEMKRLVRRTHPEAKFERTL